MRKFKIEAGKPQNKMPKNLPNLREREGKVCSHFRLKCFAPIYEDCIVKGPKSCGLSPLQAHSPKLTLAKIRMGALYGEAFEPLQG